MSVHFCLKGVRRAVAGAGQRLALTAAAVAALALSLPVHAQAPTAAGAGPTARLPAEYLDQAAEGAYRRRLVHAIAAMGKHLATLSQASPDLSAATAAAQPLPGLAFGGQQWSLSAPTAREVSACLRVPVSGPNARRSLVGAAVAAEAVVRSAAGGAITGFASAPQGGETYSLCKTFNLDRVWLGPSAGPSLFLGPSGLATFTLRNPNDVATGAVTVEVSAGFQATHDCAAGVPPQGSCDIELRRGTTADIPRAARDVRGPGLIGRIHIHEGSRHIQRTLSERRISADSAASSQAELSLD